MTRQKHIVTPTKYHMVDIIDGQPTLCVVSETTKVAGVSNLIVAVEVVGVCRSDLKEIERTRRGTPHSFGHEIAGTVVSASVNSGLEPGDRVCLNPNISGITRNSGFSEIIYASGEAQQLKSAFIKIPSNIPGMQAMLIEPLACAVNCMHTLLKHLGRKDLNSLSVGVFGAGFFGTLIALLLEGKGADTFVVNRGEEKLTFLRERGIIDATKLSTTDQIESGCFDVIIAATSVLTTEVLSKAAFAVEDGGFVHLFGGTKADDVMPGTNIDIDEIRRSSMWTDAVVSGKQIAIGGSHGALESDFKSAVALLSDPFHAMPLELLMGHRVSLEELPEFLKQQLAENNQLGKHYVDFSRTSFSEIVSGYLN